MVLNRKEEKYFELARNLSQKSNHHRYHLGCVIVNHQRIVSVGTNFLKTHPKSPHGWKMLHAEIHAILGTPLYDLKGSTIYIYREWKDGTKALAKPCATCHSLLCDCEIKRVVFTTYGGFGEYWI